MSTREDILSLAEQLERQAGYYSERLQVPNWRPARADIEDMRNLARRAASALAAPTPPAAEAPGQEPVAVKPLEWHEGPVPPSGECLASSPVGLYCIPLGRGQFVLRYRDKHTLGQFATLEDAKAAAQADYEQRIRSALFSAPPTYADAEAKGDGWHDISSAPRDGTTVDLWVDECRRVDFYCDEHGRWTRKEGYPAVWRILTVEPTHWRPRPTEPAAIRSLASPAPQEQGQ